MQEIFFFEAEKTGFSELGTKNDGEETMTFYTTIGQILLIAGCCNLLIAVLGLFPKCRATAVGYLQKTHTTRNMRGSHGKSVSLITDYRYQYTVNGRKLEYKSSGFFTKKRLYPRVSLVYVKWFPRCAYPGKFTGTKQWIWGSVLMLYGLLSMYLN